MGPSNRISKEEFFETVSISTIKYLLWKRGFSYREISSFKVMFNDSVAKKLTNPTKLLVVEGLLERKLKKQGMLKLNLRREKKKASVKYINLTGGKIYCVYVMGRGWSS
jgi:hypothetical protein